MDDHGGGESDDGGDGDGVWSPDIEQCFKEALLLFPPCGRRKVILQEEGGGKMYGRNEMIARHIKMRTGKTRTRKQVSSHIQVLARRKAKAEATPSSDGVSPSPSALGIHSSDHQAVDGQTLPQNSYLDIWMDRPIVTQKIRLVEFSAFIDWKIQNETNPANYNNMSYQQTTNSLRPTGHINNTNIAITEKQQDQVIKQEQDPCQLIQNGIPKIGGVATNQPHLVNSSTDPFPGSPQQQATNLPQGQTNPLRSNHHLTAQFNQATSYMSTNVVANTQQLTNDQTNQRLIENHQQHHQNSHNIHLGHNHQRSTQHHHQIVGHQQNQSTVFTRYSYIKIDYSQPRQAANNGLVESININQIFDKFPEIGGSEGLFYRGQSDAFFLVKFWADLNSNFEYDVGDQNSFFGYSSHFETSEPFRDITCSTKVCSYGNPLVEKVEKIEGKFNPANGRHSFKNPKSQMCDFMIEFIRKLHKVPTALVNSVLENFTVLQVITTESTSEILLCLAYVFEIFPQTRDEDRPAGPQYHVYKLTKD